MSRDKTKCSGQERQDLTQSPVANNIFRPAMFVAAHPNLFDRGRERLDNWLRYRDQNGLTQTRSRL